MNGLAGTGAYDCIDTGVIGTDAIKVAFSYKTAAVTPYGSYAVLDTAAFKDPNNSGSPRNRPALAQTFEQISGGALATAVVNHLKSKGSSCGSGDVDPEQGNCNLTRTLAAQELIDVFKNGAYADLVEDAQGEFAYTYVFGGLFKHLDYAMGKSNLQAHVSDATNWNINADEPNLLDYDTNFKKSAQDAWFEPNPFRPSDHDPVIVGLDLNVAPACSAATPSVASLWPANHQTVTISVDGVTDADGDSVAIEIAGAYQIDRADDLNWINDILSEHGQGYLTP